jgi:hypothetical protein
LRLRKTATRKANVTFIAFRLMAPQVAQAAIARNRGGI